MRLFVFYFFVRMMLLNAFLHILAYMKNQAFQGRCFMPYLPLNIYVNDSELGMCAAEVWFKQVSVFFLCSVSASLDALSRLIPGEHTTAMLSTSASHSSSEKRFLAWLKKKKKKIRLFLYLGNLIFGFLRFAANYNLAEKCGCFWPLSLFLFLRYSILNCCMGQQ